MSSRPAATTRAERIKFAGLIPHFVPSTSTSPPRSPQSSFSAAHTLAATRWASQISTRVDFFANHPPLTSLTRGSQPPPPKKSLYQQPHFVMLSAIGRATGRVGGRLAIRTVLRTTPVIPSGIRIAAVFTRHYAAAAKTTTKASATTKAKKPAAKKTTASKTTTKKATAKAKAAPKKKATKKKAAAKKPAKKRVKKVLTEEEKERVKIRKLREIALLKEEPTRLPTGAWMVYVSRRAKEASKDDDKFKLTDLVPLVAQDFKSLPEETLEVRLGCVNKEREKEREPPADTRKQSLNAQAEENKVANQVTRRNWVDSYSADRIHKANLARRLLKKKYSVSSLQIPDPRFPKRSLTVYVSYAKSRIASADLANLSAKEKIRTIAGEWKKLGPEERQVCHAHSPLSPPHSGPKGDTNSRSYTLSMFCFDGHALFLTTFVFTPLSSASKQLPIPTRPGTRRSWPLRRTRRKEEFFQVPLTYDPRSRGRVGGLTAGSLREIPELICTL